MILIKVGHGGQNRTEGGVRTGHWLCESNWQCSDSHRPQRYGRVAAVLVGEKEGNRVGLISSCRAIGWVLKIDV